jgi:hypothetical protein
VKSIAILTEMNVGGEKSNKINTIKIEDIGEFILIIENMNHKCSSDIKCVLKIEYRRRGSSRVRATVTMSKTELL